VVVGREALELWLSTHCIEAALRQDGGISSSAGTLDFDNTLHLRGTVTVSNSDIACEHGHLDPMRSKDMKCITAVGFSRLRYTITKT